MDQHRFYLWLKAPCCSNGTRKWVAQYWEQDWTTSHGKVANTFRVDLEGRSVYRSGVGPGGHMLVALKSCLIIYEVGDVVGVTQ